MTIVRLLFLVGALAAVGFAAKLALGGGDTRTAGAVSQPKRQLDDVRERVHAAEVLEQRSADRAATSP